MDAAAFEVTAELEPSIHVMRLSMGAEAGVGTGLGAEAATGVGARAEAVLRAGVDTDALWSGLSKSTRQRVRAARSAGTVITLDDGGKRLPAFAALLRERADALDIGLTSGTEYLRGWKALLEAGHARFLVAEHEDELVGGLFVYRHSGIHATAYSADAASRRRDLPGTMHLLRWTAIEDALADGALAIELGGVDLPGRRSPPQKDDPDRGLYEHKRSFGAEWIDRTPARRMILRPWVVRFAAARRGAIDRLRRMRR
jgi:lipid II:glycine glycyltransferase (peptidoglycan interpeptide bridge formation enzyme)